MLLCLKLNNAKVYPLNTHIIINTTTQPSPPFHGGKRFQLGCLGQICGTLAPFEARLLLLYAWVHLNSSLLVATLYLGPMRSLWAYNEGMDGFHLLFKGANGSDLASCWARFGTF